MLIMLDASHAERLYQQAGAARWKVPLDVFVNAIERGAEKTFAGRAPSPADIDRYFKALHLADVALACACAMGRDDAWDHFVREFRPAMYRAADALDPAGGAREIAESLYAELFGLREKDGIRQSVFRYFHGRSSLATWLRALVAQRYVDRYRDQKRTEPLAEDDLRAPLERLERLEPVEPERSRYVAAMRAALAASIAALAARDRLRLSCYYAQEMTLAQIGTLTREHEATVSRQLARTRHAIRSDVEQRLASEHRLSAAEIRECVASVIGDSGDLDLGEWLNRKKTDAARSMTEDLR